MNYGNGTYVPIPGGFNNIFSPSVPNGSYGVVTPTFGSIGNSNTTPQISGLNYVKGGSGNSQYVRVTDTTTGSFYVYGGSDKF